MLRYETEGLLEKISENKDEMNELCKKLSAQVILTGKHAPR